MKYSYFPGCTLRTKARDLDAYARVSARALGFELEEIDNWQCCGGVYPLGSDEIATKLSSVRALNEAKEKGQDLVTLCSACHHVIKRVNDDMKNVEDIRTRANNYMKLAEPYEGETEVLHFLEVLRDRIGFDELKKKVVNPLKGKKIGAYYGCLLLRPGKIMAFDNPENPTIIEDNCFIGARSEVVEGVIVEEGSVISMGVYIGQSTRIYDRETGEVHYGRVPAGSVVVSGNLPSKDGKYSLYCAVIVKKVDAKTRGKVGINELLRTID